MISGPLPEQDSGLTWIEREALLPGITLFATHYKLCTYILVYLSLCKLVKCFDY